MDRFRLTRMNDGLHSNFLWTTKPPFFEGGDRRLDRVVGIVTRYDNPLWWEEKPGEPEYLWKLEKPTGERKRVGPGRADVVDVYVTVCEGFKRMRDAVAFAELHPEKLLGEGAA